jgi:hypothetical protein
MRPGAAALDEQQGTVDRQAEPTGPRRERGHFVGAAGGAGSGAENAPVSGAAVEGAGDVCPGRRAVPARSFLGFDLAVAHELYAALFGQIEDLIKGKQLVIVPSGPLTSLPFHVLVTEQPKTARAPELAHKRQPSPIGEN